MKIPLAESFHSFQGEGTWVGTPMHFIRLPGCSVGKRITTVLTEDIPPQLPSGKDAWLCHRFDGTPFWCDTDFNKYSEVELDALISDTWERHICITGGEPLIHKELIPQIILAALRVNKMVHIETSGTIQFDWVPWSPEVWVTVSPKLNWLPSMVNTASELKLLVSDTVARIPQEFLNHSNVFLSPINEVSSGHALNPDNLELAIKTLRAHPTWKLSVQLHKYLGLR